MQSLHFFSGHTKLVSIDSAFFEGNASKHSIHTKSAVDKKLNHLRGQQKEYQKYDEQMKESDEIQICTTDADARKLINPSPSA